jgi:hypothetical protein
MSTVEIVLTALDSPLERFKVFPVELRNEGGEVFLFQERFLGRGEGCRSRRRDRGRSCF